MRYPISGYQSNIKSVVRPVLEFRVTLMYQWVRMSDSLKPLFYAPTLIMSRGSMPLQLSAYCDALGITCDPTVLCENITFSCNLPTAIAYKLFDALHRICTYVAETNNLILVKSFINFAFDHFRGK